MEIRPKAPSDGKAVAQFLQDHNALVCARADELIDALVQPALVAQDGGKVVGVLSYIPGDTEWEVLTLHARVPRLGVGSALIAAVEREADADGCRRLFLTTTNDNLDALRFYQRRGFEIVDLRRGAVNRSRMHLKPQIPRIGEYGIPIRDEIVLERSL